MGVRLFTDKLVFRRLEVLDAWSLDSATPSPAAYPAHASGSPGNLQGGHVQRYVARSAFSFKEFRI
jgi:hypothetical protein